MGPGGTGFYASHAGDMYKTETKGKTTPNYVLGEDRQMEGIQHAQIAGGTGFEAQSWEVIGEFIQIFELEALRICPI